MTTIVVPDDQKAKGDLERLAAVTADPAKAVEADSPVHVVVVPKRRNRDQPPVRPPDDARYAAPMQRVAIVTGGATGIGRALSEALAADGYGVVVGYFGNADGASDRRARGSRLRSGSVRLVRGDLGRVETAAELLDAAVTGLRRLDVMCCHAGLTVFERFVEATPASFDRVVATNLQETFFAAPKPRRDRYRAGRWRPDRADVVVTARRAVDGTAAYGMTKAGIEGLARTIAVGWRAPASPSTPVRGSIVNDRNLADDPGYAERWAAGQPGRSGRDHGGRGGGCPLSRRSGIRVHHRPHDRRRRRLDASGTNCHDVVRLARYRSARLVLRTRARAVGAGPRRRRRSGRTRASSGRT